MTEATDYRPMWAELGLDLEKHDALLGVLGQVYTDIYLTQKNRPDGMGYESEVISATARGVDRAELARGLHEAVVRRAVSMLRRLPLEDEIVFCGGGAPNGCLHELIAKALGREVRLPPAPQIVAALGAALSVEEPAGSTKGCVS